MKAHVVMMIHDALWVEAPEEEVAHVRHLMKRMMTTAATVSLMIDVRQQYTTFKPHSPLNYRPPAPEAILTTWIVRTTPGGQGTRPLT